MKKLFCKGASLLLIGSLLFAANPTAMAAVPPDGTIVEPKASRFISSYLSYIAAVGGGKIQIWFDVDGVSKMDCIGAAQVVLYESKDNKSWTKVKTYYYTSYSGMTATNRVNYTSYVPYSGVSGRYYKATVTVYAEKDGGCDSRLVYTSTKKA